MGLLDTGTPDWTWLGVVLLVDVAHVYATTFRAYFDTTELRRRPWLYGLTPLAGWLLGVCVYSVGSQLFWRLLAYLAVFHFVRQQYGWVALYRSRAGEHGCLGRAIDTTAIYLATIYPLLYWHAHLPRAFWWFLPGDFVPLGREVARAVAPFYWASLVLYGLRSIYRGLIAADWNPGKDLVVASTALCWYLGIIACNSDYAFTVTNVIIHGVPYMVIVYWYSRRHGAAADAAARGGWARCIRYLGVLWMFAFIEELAWDRWVWHDRSWLFGPSVELPQWQTVLVPLLAVPQWTHYVLDGFLWRRRSNPGGARTGSICGWRRHLVRRLDRFRRRLPAKELKRLVRQAKKAAALSDSSAARFWLQRFERDDRRCADIDRRFGLGAGASGARAAAGTAARDGTPAAARQIGERQGDG